MPLHQQCNVLALMRSFCAIMRAISTDRPGRKPNWESGRNSEYLNHWSKSSRTTISSKLNFLKIQFTNFTVFMVELEGRNQEDSLRLLLPTQHVVRPTLLFKKFLTVINRQPWGMQPPIVGKGVSIKNI